jgi:uncharacterized protein
MADLAIVEILAHLATGIAVGVASALFGIGGGLLMVPYLAIGFDFSQQLAEGTSLLVIVPTAIAGTLAHRKRGYVSFRHAFYLVPGGVVGGVTGALLANEIDADALQKVFGVFVLLMGLRLIRDGLKQRASA